eukprot:6408605-Pyramimonas_sp.AAC.1
MCEGVSLCGPRGGACFAIRHAGLRSSAGCSTQVEPPVGPRNAVLGGKTPANTTIGASSGAPCGATKRCSGRGRRMRTRRRRLRWSS